MRLASIECTRVLAILAVMVIHISPFANPFDPTVWTDPWAVAMAGFLNQVTRFAVPFFFLSAGYFLQPRLQSAQPLDVALKYCRPLFGLWVVWSAIYIVMPFNPAAVFEQGYQAAMQPQWQMLRADLLNQWWVGGMVHLWFLPALALAVLIQALCYQWRKPQWALWLGGGLFVLALLGGSYAKPLFGGEWKLLTRNGPFFSLLFVALGCAIRQYQWRLESAMALRLMLVGMALYAVEAILLWQGAGVGLNRHDFLLGSVPWAVGLFLWLLANPEWGRGSWLERQAPKVLGLYCLHMLLVIWIFPLSMLWLSPWWELAKVPLLWALAWGLYGLLAAIPGGVRLLTLPGRPLAAAHQG